MVNVGVPAARPHRPGDRPEVHVWLLEVDDEDDARRALAALPPDERDRLDRLAQPHRRRAANARAALRILAAAASGGVLPLPELVRGENGKPVLRAWGNDGHTADGRPALHLSLAHAGSRAAVALTAAGPVGVDIETRGPVAAPEAMARVTLAPEEYARWRDGGGYAEQGEGETLLLRAWVRKEAVLKALGTGLAGGLRAVGTEPAAAGGPVRITSLPPGAGPAGQWTLLDLAPGAGYAGSVAVRAPGAVLVQHRVTAADLRALARPPFPALPASVPPAPPASVSALPFSVPPVPAPPRSLPPRSLPVAAPVGRRAGRAPEPLTLLCLPGAGGCAADFRALAARLPAGVRVVALDPPGRGARLDEPLPGDWAALRRDLTAATAPYTGGRYALLGHGMGALLAVEAARELARRHRPPELLVAVARNAPGAGTARPGLHRLPDRRLAAAVRSLGLVPAGPEHGPDPLRLALPALRAELRMAETRLRSDGPPLPCPVLVFAGRRDRTTDAAGLRAWAREGATGCTVVRVDGGHLLPAEDAFLDAVGRELAVRLPLAGAVRDAAGAGGTGAAGAAGAGAAGPTGGPAGAAAGATAGR